MQRTGTIFHQNEDFVYPIRGSIPGRIDEMDDIWMAFQDTLWTISWLVTRQRKSRLRRTMMSTSFLTSVSIDSFGTAIRLRT